MLLKVNNEYLDFSDEIEIERQSRLFEEIDTTQGDFSYSFDLPKTARNLRILDIQSIDSTDKSFYSNVECLIESNGVPIYFGILKVERVTRTQISASFLSNNASWFGLLNGSCKDLDLSAYELDYTEAAASGSWTATDGVITPIIDNGLYNIEGQERGFAEADLDDLQAWFFVKTIMREIFSEVGIKLSGELLQDDLYNRIITTNSEGFVRDAESRTTLAGKTADQTISGTTVIVTFPDDTNPPYFDGSEDNYDAANNRYIADIPMTVEVEVNVEISSGAVALYVGINGLNATSNEGVTKKTFTNSGKFKYTYDLEAGDVVRIYADELLVGVTSILAGSTWKTTPTRIKRFGFSELPNLSKRDFVRSVFQMFGVVPVYDLYSKTLTLNLLKNIKTKPEQDLSDYVTDIEEVNYVDFLSDFSRINNFNFADSSDDDIQTYNDNNAIPYGTGQIIADNDFVEGDDDLIDTDFSPVFAVTLPAYDKPTIKYDCRQYANFGAEDTYNNVANSGGQAEINFFPAAKPDQFVVGRYVRIIDNDEIYTGVYRIDSTGAHHFTCLGLDFISNSSGTLQALTINVKRNDDQVIAFVKQRTGTTFYLEGTSYSTIATAHFIENELQETPEQQQLGFGGVGTISTYFNTLIDTYYSDLRNAINDPVKLICQMLIPENVFRNLDFTRPVRLKTDKFNTLFYLNKISGYTASNKKCEVELIKL